MGKNGLMNDDVSADLQKAEEREMKIERLGDEVQKGFLSGIAKDFDFAKFLQEKNSCFESANSRSNQCQRR